MSEQPGDGEIRRRVDLSPASTEATAESPSARPLSCPNASERRLAFAFETAATGGRARRPRWRTGPPGVFVVPPRFHGGAGVRLSEEQPAADQTGRGFYAYRPR